MFLTLTPETLSVQKAIIGTNAYLKPPLCYCYMKSRSIKCIKVPFANTLPSRLFLIGPLLKGRFPKTPALSACPQVVSATALIHPSGFPQCHALFPILLMLSPIQWTYGQPKDTSNTTNSKPNSCFHTSTGMSTLTPFFLNDVTIHTIKRTIIDPLSQA